MECPSCHNPMNFDEPTLNYTVYMCEDCNVVKEYDYGELVYESGPEEPMKPPVRVIASPTVVRKNEGKP